MKTRWIYTALSSSSFLVLASCLSVDEVRLNVLEAIPPGVECPSGGTRLTAGRDENGDNQLSPDEVDSTSVSCLPESDPTRPSLPPVLKVPGDYPSLPAALAALEGQRFAQLRIEVVAAGAVLTETIEIRHPDAVNLEISGTGGNQITLTSAAGVGIRVHSGTQLGLLAGLAIVQPDAMRVGGSVGFIVEPNAGLTARNVRVEGFAVSQIFIEGSMEASDVETRCAEFGFTRGFEVRNGRLTVRGPEVSQATDCLFGFWVRDGGLMDLRQTASSGGEVAYRAETGSTLLLEAASFTAVDEGVVLQFNSYSSIRGLVAGETPGQAREFNLVSRSGSILETFGQEGFACGAHCCQSGGEISGCGDVCMACP